MAEPSTHDYDPQRLTETEAEYRLRTDQPALVSATQADEEKAAIEAAYRARNASSQSLPGYARTATPIREQETKKGRPVGGAEWVLGAGGPILLILGWIISGTAVSAQEESSYESASSLASNLGWQAFGAATSWLGIGLIVILVTIQAAVSTYLRHRDR